MTEARNTNVLTHNNFEDIVANEETDQFDHLDEYIGKEELTTLYKLLVEFPKSNSEDIEIETSCREENTLIALNVFDKDSNTEVIKNIRVLEYNQGSEEYSVDNGMRVPSADLKKIALTT